MKCVIMANGEYGKLEAYQSIIGEADIVLCADGGANYACEMGLKPACIIGDMDSISPEVREYFLNKDIDLKKFPRRKDFTDTQLALSLADELGAEQIIFLGSLGKRLDHSISNLYCGIEIAEKGKSIVHYSPECCVYLVTDSLELIGQKGDLVSVLALSEEAQGVYEEGFEYPLYNVVLERNNPFAVSNVLSSETGKIKVQKGVLLVFHYPSS